MKFWKKKPVKRKAPEPPADYLASLTKHEALYWMKRVQELIAENSTAATGPLHNRHGRTNVTAWFEALSKEVYAKYPKGAEVKYDGNMRHAAVMGLILTMWFLRVSRAKAYDPRRPKLGRQESMRRWNKHAQALMAAVYDETLDAELFSGQHWDQPFSDHAIDGVFT